MQYVKEASSSTLTTHLFAFLLHHRLTAHRSRVEIAYIKITPYYLPDKVQ